MVRAQVMELIYFNICVMTSIGTGNTMVLLFSAEMLDRVCRYRSCKRDVTEDLLERVSPVALPGSP